MTPANAFVHDRCLLQDRNNGNRNRTNHRHGRTRKTRTG